ncbi:phosphoglycolate phosphatase [uncultured bacterium]|nr:phosphoglycolate phosphatase [uncultured bacterium]
MNGIAADLVIFDLDGTLIDSSGDIAWCANKTLAAFGHAEMDPSEIVGHIGWGVKPLLEKLMPGEAPEMITEARLKFLEVYGGHLVVETTLYPGVVELLDRLSGQGKKLAVVTNKPEGLASGILDVMKLSGYFKLLLGGDSLPNRKPHPEPIEKAIKELGAKPDRTIVVGDSPVDCEAAKGAGAYAIGAAYGFRGRGELEAAGCDIIVEDVPSLKTAIR